MSELRLVTIPVHVAETPDHPALNADRVVGLGSTQSATVTERGYRARGTESEQVINLADETADRIAEFYDRTLARHPGERPYFDCHVFTFYALGKALDIKEHDTLYFDRVQPVPADIALEPGEPYATSADGVMNHSMLGLNGTEANLGVLGVGMPLLVSDTGGILNIYQADTLHHLRLGEAVE